MKKILVFGASNSSRSINRQLAIYASSLLERSEKTVIDLNDFEMPIFSIDREEKNGIPALAKDFNRLVYDHDGIIISMAEHNGAYTAAFKNIFDWISRLPRPAWGEKPMLLLATSPGKRGAQSVLQIAAARFPWNGGKVFDTFSLPQFKENFKRSEGIIDPEKDRELREKVQSFEESLQEAMVK